MKVAGASVWQRWIPHTVAASGGALAPLSTNLVWVGSLGCFLASWERTQRGRDRERPWEVGGRFGINPGDVMTHEQRRGPHNWPACFCGRGHFVDLCGIAHTFIFRAMCVVVVMMPLAGRGKRPAVSTVVSTVTAWRHG